MEKSQKETSPVDPKEKKSFLDADIGKDFLSSWKSMAVTEDDAMDFSFNMASSTKNKKFNFDKLDMDFGLDGDFDKLSSFKVDMSDFDLSVPSKKAAKHKEISEDESSTGKPQEKKSQFNFSFDFNELDNFNFESSLVKEEKFSSKNNDDHMKISSDGIEQKSSKVQHSEDTSAFDDSITRKLLPASKGVCTSNVETLLSGLVDPNAIKLDCARHVCSEAPNSSSNFGSSPEEAISNTAESTDQQSLLSEKAIPIDTCTKLATFELPDQSLVGADSNRNSLSNGWTKTTYQGTGVDVSSSRKIYVNENITGLPSCHETLPLKNSSPPSIMAPGSSSDGKNKSDTEITTDAMDDNEPALQGLGTAENSSESLPSRASHISDNQENQNFATELPVDPCSGPIAGILTITNGKEAEAHCLMFPKREESAIEAKPFSSGSEGTDFMHKSPATEIGMDLSSVDVQHGINCGRNPVPAARELTKGEDALLMGAKNVKHPSNIREGITSDGLPNICKLDGNSCLNGADIKNRKPVMSKSENTVKVQNTVSLLQNQDKSDTQTSINPKILVSSLESVRMPQIKSVERNKICSVRFPKRISDQSILNISMSKGAGRVSDSTPHKDINSLQSPKHDIEVQDNASSETAYPPNSTEKQLPQNFSLKRKAFELPNSDLACAKSLKRLPSTSETRGLRKSPKQNVEDKLSRAEKSLKPLSYLSRAHDASDLKEPSKRVDIKEPKKRIEEEKVCSQENLEGSITKSSLLSGSASEIEIPQEAYVMDLELSSTIESDGNVGKAEAFAKELEDICNMLRKKHEEAKEILVRALVNNNNLLMLNHPIYEEKISNVQRYVAGLMSKELKT